MYRIATTNIARYKVCKRGLGLCLPMCTRKPWCSLGLRRDNVCELRHGEPKALNYFALKFRQSWASTVWYISCCSYYDQATTENEVWTTGGRTTDYWEQVCIESLTPVHLFCIKNEGIRFLMCCMWLQLTQESHRTSQCGDSAGNHSSGIYGSGMAEIDLFVCQNYENSTNVWWVKRIFI